MQPGTLLLASTGATLYLVPHLYPAQLSAPFCRIRTAKTVCASLTGLTERSRAPSIHRALDSLPIYQQEDDVYLVPLLEPVRDSVPLAVALELSAARPEAEPQRSRSHSARISGEAVASGLLSVGQDCFALRYVLDGNLQPSHIQGAGSSLRAGDSLLTLTPQHQQHTSHAAGWEPAGKQAALPASCTTAGLPLMHAHAELSATALALPSNASSPVAVQLQPTVCNRSLPELPNLSETRAESRPANWQAASLLFVLPANGTAADQPSAGTDPAWDSLSQIATSWRSRGPVGSLAPAELAAIIAGASNCADQAFQQHPQQPPAAQQPTPSATLLTALRGMPEMLTRGLMEAWVRPRQQISAEGREQAKARALAQQLAGAPLRRAIRELVAMRLPNQSNRLALVFDPLNDPVPFTFGIEIFEHGHRTQPHSHATAHELFFILAGQGEGFCDHERFPLGAGDVVVFPPRSVHGIDNGSDSRMYCLELMQPNDMFAELVKAGTPTGGLRDEDLCVLIAAGCTGA